MPVRVAINSNWSTELLDSIRAGHIDMLTDIHRRAVIIAPKDTRALANSGVIRKLAAWIFSITFGSSVVPYARKRHFENKKNPQTTGYLTKAADSVIRGDIGKYFRGRV